MKKLLLFVCLLTAGVSTVFANKTIYVAPSGNGSGLTAESPTTIPQALGALDATGYTTLVLPNNATFVLSGGTTGYGRIPIVDNSKIIIEGNNSIFEGNGGETRILRASTGCRVNLKNLTFRLGNAAASIGGAIFFAGDSLTISGCTFESNTADNGAAIGSRGKYIKITNSWFKDNYLRSSFQGGAISHTGKTTGGALIIENTTFSNNAGKAANPAWGTAIITAFDGSVRNYLDTISITNCTFYKNNAGLNTTAGYTAVQLDYLGSTAPTGIATTVTFVNNTFYGNSDCGIRVWGKQQAVSLINNVIVGDSWANVSDAGIQDHGLIFEFSVAEGRPALVAKNNYIVAKYPKSSKIDDATFASGNSDNNTLISTTSQTDIDNLALSTSLQSSGSSVPYLAITNSNSPLVEGGINLFSGVVIPTTDTRGVTRAVGYAGFKSDIGSYEFDNITTGQIENQEEKITVKYNKNQISISNNNDIALEINIYSTSGQLFYHATSQKALNIATNQLPKGILMLSVFDGNKTIVKKIIL